MAIDKAVDSVQLDQKLTELAEAIRKKGNTSTALNFLQGDFKTAVDNIQTGGGGSPSDAQKQYDSIIQFFEDPNCYELTLYVNKIKDRCISTFSRDLHILNLPRITIIGDAAINDLVNLTTINAPNLLKIMGNGMSHNSKLNNLDFPKLELISGSAFFDNKGLTTIILRNQKIVTLPYDSAFYYTPIQEGTGYIYVPKSLINQYKTAANWSVYANQFRAIEDYPAETTPK